MPEQASKAYYRLRAAQEYFQQPAGELTEKQQQWLDNTIDQQRQLENKILGSAEAEGITIGQQAIDVVTNELVSSYTDDRALLDDLTAIKLSIAEWRRIIERQLLVDAVLNKVAENVGTISEKSTRSWFERHPDKWIRPEQRLAFHLLITVNPNFPENRRSTVIEKLNRFHTKLLSQPALFDELTRRHSECPTALNGGEIGWVIPGKLFPELDAALFRLQENQISSPIETTLGFHLLYCKAIKAKANLDYASVADRIRGKLQRNKIKKHQKEWLSRLAK